VRQLIGCLRIYGATLDNYELDEKNYRLHSRSFVVRVYDLYPPRIKTAEALLDGYFLFPASCSSDHACASKVSGYETIVELFNTS